MIKHALFATAGLAELSPEEARQFEQTPLLVAAIPFMLYCVCVVVLLVVLLRKPSRRQPLKGRTLLAFVTLLATVGLLLFVPALPFLPSLFGP